MYRFVPAGGTVLPIGTGGDFGGSPLLGRLSNNLVLGSIDTATLVKDFLSALRQSGSRSKATATPLLRHD
jgi:hypothetical protein